MRMFLVSLRNLLLFILLLAILVDGGLVFWLLERADSARDWALAAVVLILTPGGFFAALYVLDRVIEAKYGQKRRHSHHRS